MTLFAALSIRETLKGVSEERFLRLNVLSDSNLREEITQKINEERTLSTLPKIIKPLVYNKPLKYVRVLFEGYMENLSPEFLFLRGDRNPRHNPGEWGMLYIIELLVLLFGLYQLKKNSPKDLYLLLTWILIVPLATMFLGQTHALRNNLMIPPFILISAYALDCVSKKMRFIIFTMMCVQLIAVLVTIYYYAPNKFGSFWSLEAKNASLKAIKESQDHEIMLSTDIDNIEYAYPVYAKVDPRLVISQYQKWPKIYGNVTITDQNEK